MNFQRLNILTLGLVLILVPAGVLGFVSWWQLLLLVPVYFIVLGWGVFDIGSQFFIRTFWRGRKGQISLTFDDGPHPDVTPQVLEVLKEAGATGTFFLLGENAEKYPEVAQQIIEEGHVVGNHTYNHSYVMSKAAAVSQIEKGASAIALATGKNTRYFRPPFGVMTPEIASAVRDKKCEIIGWDLRSQDGVIRTAQATINQVKNNLNKATVVLFHDTNPTTPEALKEILHLCKQNGIEIVDVPSQSGIKPYK